MRRLISCAICAALLASPALAQNTETIEGPAEVIDADILAIGKQRVILWGIDAPERSQYCLANSQQWSCYDPAKRRLTELVARGPVSCTLMDEPDPFGRRYGVCAVAGEDINAAMVKEGLALAYVEQSEDYVAMQQEAADAKIGLFQDGVEFVEPWVWRKKRTPGGFR